MEAVPDGMSTAAQQAAKQHCSRRKLHPWAGPAQCCCCLAEFGLTPGALSLGALWCDSSKGFVCLFYLKGLLCCVRELAAPPAAAVCVVLAIDCL